MAGDLVKVLGEFSMLPRTWNVRQQHNTSITIELVLLLVAVVESCAFGVVVVAPSKQNHCQEYPVN